MKKILFVKNHLGAGGAERQMVNLALGFRERGYDVHFVLYLVNGENDLYYTKNLLDNGIPVDVLPKMPRWKFFFGVRRYIRKYKADAVLAFLEGGAFLAEFASLPWHRWKLVVGERNANPMKYTLKRWRFFIHFHRFADYVVANSHANIKMVKDIAPELPNDKLKVIYNSHDKSRFKVDESFMSGERRTILVAARHEYSKNLANLILAVEKLTPEEREHLHICWYGYQNYNDDSYTVNSARLENSIAKDCFTFFEATLDIYDKMCQADAIGLFSFYEGFPNAVCEGMMSAKPIVASAVSDVPLLIKEGENGFLCDPNDVESICGALRRFLQASPSELHTMGQCNRQVAETQFDNEKVLDAYEQLLFG